MKLGILGGTFNPIHEGHLSLANMALSAYGLDRVLLLVNASPPHKNVPNLIAGVDRLEMVRAAAAPYGGLEPCDLEVRLGGVNYTVASVSRLKEMYPGAELNLIIGEDMLESFHSWREPERLVEMVRLIAVRRPGSSADMELAAQRLRESIGARILIAPFSGPDISSTSIRRRIRDALAVEGDVPFAVERIIYEKGYYFPPEIRLMQEKLAGMQNKNRYLHTMGTVFAAVELAGRHGADGKNARLAALLHDCAKVAERSILEQAEEEGLTLDASSAGMKGLLHAKIGAIYAKRLFGVEDEQVLDAIRYHTTGRAGMSLLEKIVYLADMIEPGREFPQADALRRLSKVDLDLAVIGAMRVSIQNVRERGKTLHPDTIEALEALIKENEGRIGSLDPLYKSC
ncbi:MAG: nicotinate (nicotinamide) nucleotide adenylyltransferase [Bacillota bacterium]